jgi:cell division protein FtsB
MLLWCAILFALGIAAFLDSLFNYGEIFRKVNSVLFLLISLGILVRTTTKMKAAKFEKYTQQVEELEQKVANLARQRDREKAPF